MDSKGSGQTAYGVWSSKFYMGDNFRDFLFVLTCEKGVYLKTNIFLQASPRGEVWKIEENNVMMIPHKIFSLFQYRYTFVIYSATVNIWSVFHLYVFSSVPNIRGLLLTIHSRPTSMWRTTVLTAYPLSQQLLAHHECSAKFHWRSSIYILLYWPDS